MLFQMPCISHHFHHQPFLVCRILNAYPSPSAPPPHNLPSISICDRRRHPCWLNVRNGYASSPQTIINRSSQLFTEPPFVPRDTNTSTVLPPPPRQSANPFVYIIRRLDMCVVLSTAASFFLLASPRLEYGYFSQDEKGGSGRVDGL